MRRNLAFAAMRPLSGMWVAVVVMICLVTPSPLHAQVSRISNGDMQRALEKSDESDTRGGRFSAASDGNAQFVLNRRTSPSTIELHCWWDDLLVVRSGAGTLAHSRKIRKPTRVGGYEWRAEAMAVPSSVDLRQGDVVRIAAGEAHQVAPLGDAPLVYLVVKMRSSNEFACGTLPNGGR
jgi:hypothetical protein